MKRSSEVMRASGLIDDYSTVQRQQATTAGVIATPGVQQAPYPSSLPAAQLPGPAPLVFSAVHRQQPVVLPHRSPMDSLPTELVGLPGSAPEAGNGRPMPETSFKRVDARGGLSGIAADKTVKIRLSASAASAASAPALPVVGGDGNHTPPYCRLDQLPAELMQEIFCRLHVTESRTFALVSRKLQASSQPWRDALYLLGKMAIDGDRSEPRWADILPWALEAYRNLPTLYAKKICASFSRRFCLLLITQDPFAGDQGHDRRWRAQILQSAINYLQSRQFHDSAFSVLVFLQASSLYHGLVSIDPVLIFQLLGADQRAQLVAQLDWNKASSMYYRWRGLASITSVLKTNLEHDHQSARRYADAMVSYMPDPARFAPEKITPVLRAFFCWSKDRPDELRFNHHFLHAYLQKLQQPFTPGNRLHEQASNFAGIVGAAHACWPALHPGDDACLRFQALLCCQLKLGHGDSHPALYARAVAMLIFSSEYPATPKQQAVLLGEAMVAAMDAIEEFTAWAGLCQALPQQQQFELLNQLNPSMFVHHDEILQAQLFSLLLPLYESLPQHLLALLRHQLGDLANIPVPAYGGVD